MKAAKRYSSLASLPYANAALGDASSDESLPDIPGLQVPRPEVHRAGDEDPRRALIEAQDREFAALQAADRLREVARREEAAAAATRLREQEELRQMQDEQLAQLPGEDGGVRLCIVLPDGARLVRQFPLEGDVADLHRLVLGTPHAPNFFRLLVRHSRQQLPDAGATVEEAVGREPTVLQVELREEESTDCVICLGEWTRAVFHGRLLPCGHRFCHACIRQWLAGTRRHCPRCRSPVDSNQKLANNIN